MRALPRPRNQLIGFVLVFGCISVLCPARVLAQSGPPVAEEVKTALAEIAAEERQHAGPDILGRSWLRLGKLYESQLQEDVAEDAYAHSIPLLRAAGPEAQYADALYGMGAVSVSTGRPTEGRKYFGAALAIYEKLQDHVDAANLRQAMGVALLAERKFKDAEAEFSASLAQVAGVGNPPKALVIAGYLMRSGAEFHAGNNAEALTDVARARAVAARADLPANALDRIAISLAEGAALTRAGEADQGHAAIEEALRLASTRTDLPKLVYLKLQIGILEEYSASLRAVHRKQDAKQIREQMARLQSQLPSGCEGCTVSVASLHLPGAP